ncbi:MAG: hypothetical protein JOY51_03580 [Nevskia sp.]|nr:hypothetical protein [Nevskia sp.]
MFDRTPAHTPDGKRIFSFPTRQPEAVVAALTRHDRESLARPLKNDFIKVFGPLLAQLCARQARVYLHRYPVSQHYSELRQLQEDLLDILVTELIFDCQWPFSFLQFSRGRVADPVAALQDYIRWRARFLWHRLLSQLQQHVPTVYLQREELAVNNAVLEAVAELLRARDAAFPAQLQAQLQVNADDPLLARALGVIGKQLLPLPAPERRAQLQRLHQRMGMHLHVATAASTGGHIKRLANRMLQRAAELLGAYPATSPEHRYLACFLRHVGQGETFKAIAGEYGTMDSTIFQWVRKAGRLLKQQDPYLELLWEQAEEAEGAPAATAWHEDLIS